jgi:hypothetical protein
MEMCAQGSVGFKKLCPGFFSLEGVAGGVSEAEVGCEPISVGFLLRSPEVEGCFVVGLYLQVS